MYFNLQGSWRSVGTGCRRECNFNALQHVWLSCVSMLIKPTGAVYFNLQGSWRIVGTGCRRECKFNALQHVWLSCVSMHIKPIGALLCVKFRRSATCQKRHTHAMECCDREAAGTRAMLNKRTRYTWRGTELTKHVITDALILQNMHRRYTPLRTAKSNNLHSCSSRLAPVQRAAQAGKVK